MSARAYALTLAWASVASPAIAATPQEVVALVAGKLGCPRLDTAAGWTATSETVQDQDVAVIVQKVDRKRRRQLFLIKSWTAGTPERWHLDGIAFVDGKIGTCHGDPGQVCVWDVSAAPKRPMPDEISGTYLSYLDFAQPGQAGAAVTVADATAADAVPVARWHLHVTPPGGLELAFYADETGRIVATDTPTSADGSTEPARELVTEWQVIDGCEMPKASIRTVEPAVVGPMTVKLTGFEFHDQMPDSEFALELPAAFPDR